MSVLVFFLGAALSSGKTFVICRTRSGLPAHAVQTLCLVRPAPTGHLATFLPPSQIPPQKGLPCLPG